MDYKKQYERWVKYADEATKKELLALTDEREIEDRFRCSMQFGTGGLRGVLGAGTNRMNIYTVRKATQGYADFVKQQGDTAVNRGVAIAYDNRWGSKEFAENTAGVLAANGIKVYLFESLRPMPELSFAVRELRCFGGVMITASHNPPRYNGYKLYDETGCQLVPRYTDQLIRYIDAVEDELHIACLPLEEAGARIEIIGKEVDERYYQKVRGILFEPDIPKNIKIVFSPQHGTGNVPIRRMLDDLGYAVLPVEEQCAPDPAFSNTKNPNPETEEAFALPLEKAEQAAADLAITTDPDCDRLGVAIRHQGGYVRLTGNQTGAVMLQYILRRRKERGTLPADGLLINTIVTSSLGDEIAASYGVKTEKTLTGFKFIGDKIQTHQTLGDGSFIFGYEESLGYLIGDFVRDKDAVQAAVMLCEMAAYYQNRGKTLYDVLLEIYETYGYYKDCLHAIELEGKDGLLKIQAIMQELRDNPLQEAGGINVRAIEDYLEPQDAAFPKSDVLRYLLEDGSWVAVRPSGTEPKCKFYYCVKGETEEAAQEKLRALQDCFEVLAASAMDK